MEFIRNNYVTQSAWFLDLPESKKGLRQYH